MIYKERSLWQSAKVPFMFCAFISLIHGLSVLTKVNGFIWGIVPRAPESLPGIFFAPLIHADITHLFSNIGSLLLLGTALWFFYPRIALRSVAIIWPFTGLLVWVFGKQMGAHVGASGLVYGLIGVLFSLAIFRRSVRAGMIALVIGLLYSGSVEGLFPNKAHVSWESHLFGLIVGIFCGFLFRRVLEPEEREAQKQQAFEEAARAEARNRPKGYFLPRDIFERTRAELAAEKAAQQQNWIDDLLRGID